MDKVRQRLKMKMLAADEDEPPHVADARPDVEKYLAQL